MTRMACFKAVKSGIAILLIDLVAVSYQYFIPPSSTSHINVTGYANYEIAMEILVVPTPVTWYTAVRACQELGSARMDNTFRGHLRTSIATAMFLELGGFEQSVLWTSNYRQDRNSDQWVAVLGDFSCAPIPTPTFDVRRSDEQCSSNVYRNVGEVPSFITKNCSELAGFECIRWRQDLSDFNSYPGYDAETFSPALVTTDSYIYNTSDCQSACKTSPYCISLSHNVSNDDCRIYSSYVYGVPYVNYSLVYVGNDVTHYTKQGTPGVLTDITNNTNIVQYDLFECPQDTTTETLSSTETVTSTFDSTIDTESNLSSTTPVEISSTLETNSTIFEIESTSSIDFLNTTTSELSTVPETNNTVSDLTTTLTDINTTSAISTTSDASTITSDVSNTTLYASDASSSTSDTSTVISDVSPSQYDESTTTFGASDASSKTSDAITVMSDMSTTTSDVSTTISNTKDESSNISNTSAAVSDETTSPSYVSSSMPDVSPTQFDESTTTSDAITTSFKTKTTSEASPTIKHLITTTSDANTTTFNEITTTSEISSTTSDIPITTTPDTTSTTATVNVTTITNQEITTVNISNTSLALHSTQTSIHRVSSEAPYTSPSATCTCQDYCLVTTESNEIAEIDPVETLIKNLTVNRRETNRYKLTLKCAEDDRSSSKAIGTVAVVIIFVVFGVIALSDTGLFLDMIRYGN